jgi:hypothetical protein
MEDTTEENRRLVHEIVMANSVEERFLQCAQLFEAGKVFALMAMPKGLTETEKREFIFKYIYGTTPDELLDGDWLRISYSGYYDYPEVFVVDFENYTFMFRRDFDETLDDYPNEYVVFRSNSHEKAKHHAILANPFDGEVVGLVSVSEIDFDPTHRAYINANIFTKLNLNA